jgi:hypothetical protein
MNHAKFEALLQQLRSSHLDEQQTAQLLRLCAEKLDRIAQQQAVSPSLEIEAKATRKSCDVTLPVLPVTVNSAPLAWQRRFPRPLHERSPWLGTGFSSAD